MKRVLPMFLLLFLIGSTFMQINPVEIKAQTLDQVKQQRQQIKKNLSKKEAEIADVLEEIAQLNDEIMTIEKEIINHDQKIAETEKEILQYEDDFYRLVDKITELNEAIEVRSEILNNRLAAYQENGGDISFLEVILNAKSFTEFISRVSTVSTITNADRELIEQQNNDKEKVEKHQQAILKKIEEQENLIKQLEKEQSFIKEKNERLKQSQKDMKHKEKLLKKEKASLTSQDSELSKLEKSYRNEIKTKNQEVSNLKKTSATPVTSTKQKDFKVGATFTMQATAYTPFCSGCSGVTATGINVKGDSHQNIIAVDPNVIPLGSRVWVEGYGEAIAADKGSAIVGNRIDVLFKSDKRARQWGVRTVTVKILD